MLLMDVYGDDVGHEDGIATRFSRHTVLNQCTYVVIDEALKLQLLYAVMEAMAHRKIDKDGDSPRIAGLNDHSLAGGLCRQ